ncbi:MAG: FkbM family methyltransferase, partial [Gammaproteobacteria bacterium]|nr:FkbM family methyltransferase [Gammaproteobacteria bacterium]
MNNQIRDSSGVFADACRLFAANAYAECESACYQLLGETPNRFDVLVLLGDACTMREAFEAAADAYRKAQAVAPGHALPFTRLACLDWRRRFGPPPVPRQVPPGVARIQMTSLGANGRFGNQLLQYGFLKLYARRHGLVAETPEWIGRYVYGFDDPVPRESLPALDEQETDLFAAMRGLSSAAPRDVNLQGYFCGDTGRWGNVAEEFRALFKPVAAIRKRLDVALDRLRDRGSSLVAIHARRGDFGHGRFWIAPSAWYRAWLADLWPRLTRPVLYIATDDPEVAGEFRDYGPVLGRELESNSDLPDYVLDHHILSHADHLAISNSSFSFSAAMLNASAKEFQRPDPNLLRMVPFDPWHAPVLIDPEIHADAVSPGERGVIRTAISPGQAVVYIGSHCSGWTNVVRRERPGVTVREAEHGTSLDKFRMKHGMSHIHHLRLEKDLEISNVIDGARETLSCARVDTFHLAAGFATQRDAVKQLQRFGYRFFTIADNGVLGPANATDPNPAPQIAIHERLLPIFTRADVKDLDLPALCEQYGITVNRVVHVGAHEGKELSTYDAIGAKSVVFVEANPAVFERLVSHTKHRHDVTNIQRAVADRRGTVTLHIASFDQSSSILPMHVHQSIYPNIVPAGTMEVQATPLDVLLEECGIPYEDLSLLCVDVQGVEHLVLRGARRVLDCVQGVQVEVNFAELYRDGARIEDIESLLGAAGFHRVALVSGYHPTWGDAFYVRESLVTPDPQPA